MTRKKESDSFLLSKGDGRQDSFVQHLVTAVRSDLRTVLLCLHQWGSHDHPTLASPASSQPGNGLLLFFRVDDFDAALARARGLVAKLEQEPGINPSTGTREFALRDPDGYYVMVSAWD